MSHPILVTGGAGFIGTNFIKDWLLGASEPIINLDAVTYAGNPANLSDLEGDVRYTFVRGDISDAELVRSILDQHRPQAIVHFAAESHVDRSIYGPAEFVRTNVQGTLNLLQCACDYWRQLSGSSREYFRFLHVSTDEVFGSLGESEPPFCEDSRYAPNSPYSASKAAADHLVRAFHHTYGLPTLTTHCSNNYGPFQFPEKLIPLTILNALEGKFVPVYGDGENIRDWLYVADHCHALCRVLRAGVPGDTYNIGGRAEKRNLDVVRAICRLLDELRPLSSRSYEALISLVSDRPGHDRRYAMNVEKLERKLGWRAEETFESGLRKTVLWYLNHLDWAEGVRTGAYREWMRIHYAATGS